MDPNKSFSVIVFISGRGSNLTRIIEQQGTYQVSTVISDNPQAEGLQVASALSIPWIPFNPASFSSKQTFFKYLQKKVQDLKPDLLVLAGFMRILPPFFVDSFAPKIINIHPSLLPKHRGLNSHQRALESGESESGCTVHIVDSGVDTGPPIAQCTVSIDKGETVKTLSEKVLKKEHLLYPWVIHHIASGNITLNSPTPSNSARVAKEAKEKGFILMTQQSHNEPE